MDIEVPSFMSFVENVLNWPLQAQVGIGFGFLTWIVGLNLITHFSQKRSGVELPEEITSKTLMTDVGFNRKEVFYFIVCGAVGIGLLAWGASVL